MKDKILNTTIVILMVVAIGMIIQFSKVPLKVNCEFCGEQFDTRHSTLNEICDICFGWNEHKASLTEEGLQLNFANGEGYYFEGKLK